MKSSTNNNLQEQWARILFDSVTGSTLLDRYSLWSNPTNPNSLRLRPQAYKWILKRSDFKFFTIDLQRPIAGRQYLQLERLLTSPYVVINLKTIAVHSETDAIMLQLNAGDLVSYLNNLEANP